MIDRTLTIGTIVDDLTSAFAFVMESLDEVTEPMIEIRPIHCHCPEHDDGSGPQYDVSVTGSPVSVKEPA